MPLTKLFLIESQTMSLDCRIKIKIKFQTEKYIRTKNKTLDQKIGDNLSCLKKNCILTILFYRFLCNFVLPLRLYFKINYCTVCLSQYLTLNDISRGEQ